MIPFMRNVQYRQIQRQDIHGLQETDWGRGEWEVTAVGEVSFSGDEVWN